MTTFEQAWRDAYGSVDAWERERHGTAADALRPLSHTEAHVVALEAARSRRERRRDLTIRELTDARDAARRVMERRP